MTRVHHARPLHAPQRSIALDQPRAAVKKKKPYKIVLEAVTQEKKKLHSIVRHLRPLSYVLTDRLSANLRLQCARRVWFRPSWKSRDYRMVQRAVPPAEPGRAYRFSPRHHPADDLMHTNTTLGQAEE